MKIYIYTLAINLQNLSIKFFIRLILILFNDSIKINEIIITRIKKML
jgi:hypothetical protein